MHRKMSPHNSLRRHDKITTSSPRWRHLHLSTTYQRRRNSQCVHKTFKQLGSISSATFPYPTQFPTGIQNNTTYCHFYHIGL